MSERYLGKRDRSVRVMMVSEGPLGQITRFKERPIENAIRSRGESMRELGSLICSKY